MTTDAEALRTELARLQREQAWQRTILSTAPAVVMRLSLDGVIEFINRVQPEYEARHPLGRSIFSFAPADQHEVMRAAMERVTRTLLPSSFESAAEAPDGTRDWYASTMGPILDEGRLVGLTMVSVNANRARQAEEALQVSQASLKLALDAGNVGVWRWDQRTDLVEWDEKLTAMFGLEPNQHPRTVADFLGIVPENQRQAMGAHIQRALETGLYPDFELEVPLATGTRCFIIKGGILRGAHQEVRGLLGGVVDVTERRRMEEHLRQTQKLEAVGQLSSGVAHNFNNMLAVILPALELARAEARGATASLLDDALTSATNAAQLVRQLMVFSPTRARALSRQEPLSDVVRRAVELCRRTFGRHLEWELGELEAARHATVDSAEMEQVVMNLLLNARDALAGELPRPPRISLSSLRLTEPEVRRAHAEASGAWVELRVEDNGTGMDATTRRRMLEPFFSTKPAGRGTGLGLTTAWATVQAHRGFLDCESQLGRGTRFSLLLPATASAQPLASAAPPAPTRSLGAGRVVLLIEDEEAVRRASAAVLSAAGFEVLLAASGEEGLRLAAQAPVDAVVMDYSMPGLSPQECLAALRRADPGLPVLCLSGMGLTLEGVTAQLVKPVSRAELLAAVEAALSQRPLRR